MVAAVATRFKNSSLLINLTSCFKEDKEEGIIGHIIEKGTVLLNKEHMVTVDNKLISFDF